MPRISVVLPVYNSELYIRQCIKSVLAQTYKDFELLIIEDGSSDKSLSIIESIKDRRIRIFENKENKGLIYSLNKGIYNCEGNSEFIARMDSDDLCYLNRFEKQVNYFKVNKTVGLLGGARTQISKRKISRNIYFPIGHKKILSTLFFYNPFNHDAVMFRSNIKSDLNYDENFYKYEDYAMWINLINICNFDNLKDRIIYVRKHEESVTSSYKNEPEEDIKRFQKVIKLLEVKLNVSLTIYELNLLSIITSSVRAQTNKTITVDELCQFVNTMFEKLKNLDIDTKYLWQLLIERSMFYLVYTKRINEILSFVQKVKCRNEFFSVIKSVISGRKWQSTKL